MPVNAANVPSGLKSFDRWVCWSWIWSGKKYDKPPLNARTGGNASSTNAKTWVSFDEAYEAHRSGRFDGIGFTLGIAGSSGIHFSGFDADDSVIDGIVNADAMYMASMIDSYTEISPSGNGIKVFLTGPLLGEGRKKDDARGIEFYDGGRYFTVTGNRIDGFPADVMERSQAFSDLRDMTFKERLRDVQSELSQEEIALSALAGLNPQRAEGYYSWMEIGFALHSVGDNMLSAWDEWSKASSKYAAGECAKKWRTMKAGGIHLGTLIKFAQQDGWKWPEPQAKKSESNGKHTKPKATPESEPEEPATRFELADSEDNDPSMGNGLTDPDDAGPWKLRIEMSNPRRYWLRSPIWEKSLDLKQTAGYILLTKRQLSSWQSLRIEAIDQSGIYVKPEKSKKPVWDGRGGPRLYRRLLHNAERVMAPPDFDRVLMAAEWIVDCCRRGGVMDENKRELLIGKRSAFVLEDGSMVFKLRQLASMSKKESSGFAFEDLRDAAKRFGEQYCPEVKGRRHRYYKFSVAKVSDLENELIRKGKIECV